MKKLFSLLFILTAALANSGNAQLITNFGTDASDGGSGWSYNPATSQLSGTESFGSGLFGVNSPYNINITGATGISLEAKVTTDPGSNFTVTLEDGSGQNRFAIAQFDWSDFVGPNSSFTVFATFNSVSPSFDFTNVDYWTLDGGSSGNPIGATLIAASAVPEPNTWVVVAGALTLLMVFRRRLRLQA